MPPRRKSTSDAKSNPAASNRGRPSEGSTPDRATDAVEDGTPPQGLSLLAGATQDGNTRTGGSAAPEEKEAATAERRQRIRQVEVELELEEMTRLQRLERDLARAKQNGTTAAAAATTAGLESRKRKDTTAADRPEKKRKGEGRSKGKRKSAGKKRRGDSDTSDSSTSSSETGSSGSDSEGSEDRESEAERRTLTSRRTIESLYRNRLDNVNITVNPRTQAEGRFNLWALLAEKIIHKETVETKGQQEAMEQSRKFLAEVLEVRSRAILDFDGDRGSVVTTKVDRVNKKVTDCARKFPGGAKAKRLGKEMLQLIKQPKQPSGTGKPAGAPEYAAAQTQMAPTAARPMYPAPPTQLPVYGDMLQYGGPPGPTPMQFAQQQQAAQMPMQNAGYPPQQRRCFICGLSGHVKAYCPMIMQGVTPQQQQQGGQQQMQAMQQAMPQAQSGGPQRPPGTVSAERAPQVPPHREEGTQARSIRTCGSSYEAVMDVEFSDIRHKERVRTVGAETAARSGCRCGYCGECTTGIDLMQKEQREHLGPARLEAARQIELQQQALDATYAREEAYSATARFRTQAERGAEEQAQERAWHAAAEEETEDREVRGSEAQGGEHPGQNKIGETLRGTVRYGKKAFDKYDPSRLCTFCTRRGHRRAECMVAPATEEVPVGEEKTTALQRAKRAFVLGLIRRDPPPEVTTLREAGDHGWMPAVRRALRLGHDANTGNPWADSVKRRDKLRRALGFWWAIGADATVLSWIGFGVRLRFEAAPNRMHFQNHKSYEAEKEHIQKEHDMHVRDGSYRVGTEDEVHVGNPLQVEVNEKGKRRTCVDMRYTNSFLADYEFTQETLNKHVAQIVKQFMEMITTDVEKAYYQVALHKESQRFCAWWHEGQWILPTILVFGLCFAPFVFTKIMRVVLRFMRAMGIRGTNCIDDNLWAATADQMEAVKAIVQLVFGVLGWKFNDKCVLIPSRQVIYNGMWIDSERFEIRATDAKIEAARRLAWKLWYAARDGEAVSVNDLQRLAGRLQSMKLALEGVAVWTRGIYADIAQATEGGRERIGGRCRSLYTHLRWNALQDLNFWALRLGKQNGLPIHDTGSEVHIQMNSDASDVGWGAHTDVPGSEVRGELPTEVLGASSTAREIMGVILAARQLERQLRGRRVRVCMDSLPAICNFINGGGPVEQLNVLVRRWWTWCYQQRVTPLYEWIRREYNTTADGLSKEAARMHTLTLEAEIRVREWLDQRGLPGTHGTAYTRTRVITPWFDSIVVRVQEMIRTKKWGCVVVPAWKSAVWRVELVAAAKDMLYVGRMSEVLRREEQITGHAQRWGMEAFIVGGETRGAAASEAARPR